MTDIAWESFYLCGNRTRNDHAATRSKLVHNWLNLGVQRAKHGIARLETLRECPYCALPEDFVHLLSCADPRAMTSRYDASVVLKKALTDSVGGNSLFRAVKQWTLHPTEAPTVQSCAPGYQLAIDRAVQSQSAIGWLNLFRGLVSSKWGLVVAITDSSYAREECTPQAINHLAVVIRSLQDYSLAIWKSRNDTLHQNAEQSSAILHAQLHHDITCMYALRDTFSPILQSYFSMPLEDNLLRSSRQKQRWIRLARLATSHATSKGSRQQVMSSYFPHQPAPAHSSRDPIPALATLPSTVSTYQQVPIHQYLTSHERDTINTSPPTNV